MSFDTTISRHTETSGAFFRFTWACWMLAAIALLLAVIFATAATRPVPMYGYIAAAISVLAAVGLVITSFVMYSGLVRSATVYLDRLEWSEDGRKVAVAWEEISEVTRAEVYLNGTLSRREITIKAGRHKPRFTYILSNWKTLAEGIQEYTQPHLWAAAVADFNSGNKVRFGRELAVSRDTITVSGKTLNWDRVSRMIIHNGFLVVFAGREGEYHASLADTPNTHVLVNLLHHCPVPLS